MIKRILIFTIAVLLIILNYSCKKEERSSITYPITGVYVENVLALADNSILNNTNGYSLCAELGSEAELKIVIINLSGAGAVWFYGNGDGWTVGNYTGNSQQFVSNKDGTLDLEITFENGPGSCRVDFYENSSSVTNSRSFSW